MHDFRRFVVLDLALGDLDSGGRRLKLTIRNFFSAFELARDILGFPGKVSKLELDIDGGRALWEGSTHRLK